MKQWVTGQKADMEQEDIDRELFELAREWMAVSKLRKIPVHVAKETDVSPWKQFRRNFREHPKQKGAILVRLFQCRLKHHCGFLAGIRIMENPAPTGYRLMGVARTMQTVTMKISPSQREKASCC
jgi:hypothetical protein